MRRAGQTLRQRLSEHLRTEHATSTVTAYGYDKLVAFHRGLHVVEAPGPGGHYHHDGDYGLRFAMRTATRTAVEVKPWSPGMSMSSFDRYDVIETPAGRALLIPSEDIQVGDVLASTSRPVVTEVSRGMTGQSWPRIRVNNENGAGRVLTETYVAIIAGPSIETYADMTGIDIHASATATFRTALDGFSVDREDAARVYAHPRAREAVSLLEDEYAAVAETGTADPVVATIASDLGMDPITVLTALIAALDDEEADALFESISPTGSARTAEWTSVCANCSKVFHDLTDRCPRCGSENVEDLGDIQVDASARTAARSYTQVGASYPRDQVDSAIDSIAWRDVGGDWPAMAGLAIELAITEFGIPKVDRAGISTKLVQGRFEVYGIQGTYANGTARIYVLDEGNALTPVASELLTIAKRADRRPKRKPDEIIRTEAAYRLITPNVGMRREVYTDESHAIAEAKRFGDRTYVIFEDFDERGMPSGTNLTVWTPGDQVAASKVANLPSDVEFVPATELREGDVLYPRYLHTGVGEPVTVVRGEPDAGKDSFGRTLRRFWVRGEDGREGYVSFGESEGGTYRKKASKVADADPEPTPEPEPTSEPPPAAVASWRPSGWADHGYTLRTQAKVADVYRSGERWEWTVTSATTPELHDHGVETSLDAARTSAEASLVEYVGASSGLDYAEDVAIEGGLLTCSICGRLPGYHTGPGVAREAAKRHLQATHRMLLEDVEGSLSKGAPTTPARNPYTPTDNPFSQAREPNDDPIDEGPLATPPPGEVGVQPEEVEGQPTTTRPRGTQPEQMGATR